MGKIKYMREVKAFIKNVPVFRSKDIEVMVRNKKYAHVALHNMIKNGEIRRITKGCYCYSTYEDPILSVFCFRPAYIGLQEALSLHNVWEQETNVVIVTTKRARIGVREVFENNVIVHRINPKYFFGFDLLEYENFHIPVSDLEKTFIDLVYFGEIPDKEVIRILKKRIDVKKLKSYLKFYAKNLRMKVLKHLE